MSRSGYTDDPENLALWRGAVNRAIQGKRGQAFLRELAAAMDAMPQKTLADSSFQTADGEFCTLGTVGAARGLDMSGLVDLDDDEAYCDTDAVGKLFGIAPAMAAEIMFLNDEIQHGYDHILVEICGPMRPVWPSFLDHRRWVHYKKEEGGPARWKHMRSWVEKNLAPSDSP
ncbi:hypothetical protein WAE61_01860 [Comamonadaceae bacterium PP-2]